jgi:preprotein translocase subunit SecG
VPILREISDIYGEKGGTFQMRPDALKTRSTWARRRKPNGPEGLDTMQTLLLVAELIIAVALIGFVLLQRSEGGALGIGGGGGGGMGGLFTPRGAADTLTRTTAILAFLFFATCIALNILALRGRDEASILDTAPLATPGANQPAKPVPAPALPVGPSVPKPQ